MTINPKKVVRPQTSKPSIKSKKGGGNNNGNNCSNQEYDEQNMNLNEIV